jgi:hypothetical protein
LISTVLSSLIGCPEEISRVTAVNILRLLYSLLMLILILKKDSITNKLLQITDWLKINKEKISFEVSYLISIRILNTLGLNLLVIPTYIFIS